MTLIALETFLRTGIFGPIHLGMPRAEVRALMGRPWAYSTRKDGRGRPLLWKYGDIELGYDPNQDSLWSIQLEMDNHAVPSGWRRVVLDPWVLRGGIAPEEVERALRGANISYKHLPARSPDDYLVLETAARVRLGFIREEGEHSPPQGLYYLLLMDWSSW